MSYKLLSISDLREELRKNLEEYKSTDHYYLDIDKEIYRDILLNKDDYSFAIDFNLVKILDLSNFSFDNVNVKGLNFKGSKGVIINPQKIFEKDLSFCNLEDVTINGSFNDVLVYYTNFKGARGVEINPQTVRFKNMSGSILDGVKLTGPFYDVLIKGTDFNGSIGAVINPQTALGYSLKYVNTNDATIVDSKIKYPTLFTYYDKIGENGELIHTKVKKLKRK